MFQYSYDTIIGKIFIAEENGFIVHVSFKDIQAEQKETDLIKKTYLELTEYFNGERQIFDVPLSPEGTQFRKKVWEELKKIPYGNTTTYKEIARRTGNEKACRAVGMANNKNPIAIIIPCHRVIGSKGNLTGYAGGLDVKNKLLQTYSIQKNIALMIRSTPFTIGTINPLESIRQYTNATAIINTIAGTTARLTLTILSKPSQLIITAIIAVNTLANLYKSCEKTISNNEFAPANIAESNIKLPKINIISPTIPNLPKSCVFICWTDSMPYFLPNSKNVYPSKNSNTPASAINGKHAQPN